MSDEGNDMMMELRAERDELFAEARQRAADAGRLYAEREVCKETLLGARTALDATVKELLRVRAVAVRLRDELARYQHVDNGYGVRCGNAADLLADPEVQALEGVNQDGASGR